LLHCSFTGFFTTAVLPPGWFCVLPPLVATRWFWFPWFHLCSRFCAGSLVLTPPLTDLANTCQAPKLLPAHLLPFWFPLLPQVYAGCNTARFAGLVPIPPRGLLGPRIATAPAPFNVPHRIGCIPVFPPYAPALPFGLGSVRFGYLRLLSYPPLAVWFCFLPFCYHPTPLGFRSLLPRLPPVWFGSVYLGLVVLFGFGFCPWTLLTLTPCITLVYFYLLGSGFLVYLTLPTCIAPSYLGFSYLGLLGLPFKHLGFALVYRLVCTLTPFYRSLDYFYTCCVYAPVYGSGSAVRLLHTRFVNTSPPAL